MEATKNAAGRSRLVRLDEFVPDAEVAERLSVIDLEKQPTLVSKDVRLDQQHAVQAGQAYLHPRIKSSSRPPRLDVSAVRWASLVLADLREDRTRPRSTRARLVAGICLDDYHVGCVAGVDATGLLC